MSAFSASAACGRAEGESMSHPDGTSPIVDHTKSGAFMSSYVRRFD
jgi:hypothetical protein